jgi:peptidoglycan hydrolase CwlO-like protein
MKKLVIILVLIFGITIAVQNNTATGQEKTYTQTEVDLTTQVQDSGQQVAGIQENSELHGGKCSTAVITSIILIIIVIGAIIIVSGIGIYITYFICRRKTKKAEKRINEEIEKNSQLRKEIETIRNEVSKFKNQIQNSREEVEKP